MQDPKAASSEGSLGTLGAMSPRRLSGQPPPMLRLKMSSMEEENMLERLRLALLRECSARLTAENTSKITRDVFRRAFLERDLLQRLFRLFDHDRDGLLHQEEWVEFLKARLTDEKQVDFAEQVESVAYVLCGDAPITLEKFCEIFNAKGVLDKLYRLVDLDSDGVVTPEQVIEFISNISSPRPLAGFDAASLEWLEQLFRQTVGDQNEIRRDDFKKIVISKNPFFTERVFQIFDKDNSGTISLQEFIDAMHQFAGQSTDDKIRFLFKVYDLDGDGLIQHKELQHVMRACMEENGMKFSEEQVEDLTMALFEDADVEIRGAITFEALKAQLEKHDGLLENLTISIDRWLVPPKPKPTPKSIWGKLLAMRPYQFSMPYVKNNYVYLAFLLLVIIVNIGLFVSRAIQYRESNWYTIFARACGQCLNFNCMFVLVLMLRQCITFLRTRGWGVILPLDQHIYFHKLTGVLIFVYSVVHTIMHLINFTTVVVYHPEINAANYTAAEWLFTAKPGLFGLIPGVANPTGFALLAILIIMFICSQPFVRRGGCFEIFYYTHLLYIPFWILTLLHGPNFWKWYVIPGAIYLIERVVRFVNMQTQHGQTYISSGILLPSKVTHLVIKRPPHFVFHPGDYVFVSVPAIAKYESHPFTISSAPEQGDTIWLHIRGVGQWTNRLYEYFEHEQERLHSEEQQQPIPPMIEAKPGAAKIQASIMQKFGDRDRSVGFRGDGSYSNESFDITDETVPKPRESPRPTAVDNPSKMALERRIQSLTNGSSSNASKTLEKSLSMPDMQTRMKKRQRVLALREFARSESEKSFNEAQVRRARLQSLGLAYLSPQNRTVAQSFRYMRHKPTIIAFKTPSMEEAAAEADAAAAAAEAAVAAKATAPDHRMTEVKIEEGRVPALLQTSVLNAKRGSVTPAKFPIGKPLELLRPGHIQVDCRLKIIIDGPYGAPSSHIFRAQHAVLIGTGIGVTPFASILQSIMHRYWKARHQCPRCDYAWASDIPATVMNLRKVDFFWINRDQRSFEWFVNLLSQLEIEQAELGGAMERFLEMHMYITSALQKTDMKAVGLQLALDLLHQKEKRDLITGLKTRTNAGRPNWDKVFKQIADQKKGKVTVFYCGPPQLARTLRVKCDQFGFNFRKESF
ncbi:NADPH oxidase 5 isoform X1 [Cloeon dipterum]|uniref:NADPH oxidase 5 isoform X1 n=1 Tax=Cloeon dipterum TaxID=197152 RepID=UPI00321FF3A0